MKTFLTRSKSKLGASAILLLALVTVAAHAETKPVAEVTGIQGTVFVVTPDGATRTLKNSDHIELKSEIMVDEGSSISLNDYYDATYHLAGGSHVKFFDKSVQLKRGKTWIQSQSARHPLNLTTANGHVNFWKGEFISTFDQSTSRSQFLVVNGEVEVSNILDQNMKYSVPAGSFTLVDPEVENGSPRAPTKVGLSSLNTALAEFKAFPAKQDSSSPERTVASVEEKKEPVPEITVPKKGEIIFMKSGRLPASVRGSAHTYFKKKVSVKKVELTSAPIKFYGVNKTEEKAVAPRVPASVAPVQLPKRDAPIVKIDPEFTDTLKKQEVEQPKHPKELDRLIEDLKSY
jgi:hypothetical protein